MQVSFSDTDNPRVESKASPFFIVGVGRSGTTLLRLMLNAHPNVAIPYETHFLDSYAKRREEFGDLSQLCHRKVLVEALLREEMVGKWDYIPSAEEVLNRIQHFSVAGVVEALFDAYAGALGKARWGDKSDYLDTMHVIADFLPNARFVHIVRDGRDVANSVLRLPWGPRDLIAAADWWHGHVRTARMVGTALGPKRYAEVRYEDLVENPTRELRRLCEFLDLEWAPVMLEYHNAASGFIPEERKSQHLNVDKPLQKNRTYAWRLEMSPARVSVFENHAIESLHAYGYEAGSREVSPVQSTLIKCGVLAARVVRRSLHRFS